MSAQKISENRSLLFSSRFVFNLLFKVVEILVISADCLYRHSLALSVILSVFSLEIRINSLFFACCACSTKEPCNAHIHLCYVLQHKRVYSAKFVGHTTLNARNVHFSNSHKSSQVAYVFGIWWFSFPHIYHFSINFFTFLLNFFLSHFFHHLIFRIYCLRFGSFVFGFDLQSFGLTASDRERNRFMYICIDTEKNTLIQTRTHVCTSRHS